MNTIDQEMLSRMEVVRGPSSVLYGSDAIGGTVNMIPVSPLSSRDATGISFNSSVRYSTADQGRVVHADVSAARGGNALMLGTTYKNCDNLRAGGDIGDQVPTGWEEYNISAIGSTHLTDQFKLNVDYLAARQDDVPRYDKYVSGDFETYLYGPQDRDLACATLQLNRAGSSLASAEIKVSYQRETEGITKRKPNATRVDYSQDRIDTWGLSAQATSFLNDVNWLTYGAEIYSEDLTTFAHRTERNTVTTLRPDYPDGSTYISSGAYIQDELRLSAKLRLTTGVRYSAFKAESDLEDPFGHLRETYDNLTGSIAALYSLTGSVRLAGSISRGFRAPNLNDLVVLQVSSSGIDAPSTNLSPEKSTNFEAGVKVRNDRGGGNLFVFYNVLDDMIDRRPGTYNGLTFFDDNNNGIRDDGEFDIYQQANVGKGRIYGFEADADFALSDRFSSRANLFWTEGTNTTDDESMSRIPPLMGMFALNYQADDTKWFELLLRGAGAQHKLSQRDKDDTRIGEHGTPSWFTTNLKFGYSMEPVRLNLAIMNIFDRPYKEHGSGIYSPGRNVVLSISISG